MCILGLLYIADTYNSRIKTLNSTSGTVTALAGAGTSGHADGPFLEAQFNEPGGLTALDNRLYIADTNNQEIRVLDLDAETVSTLDITL